MTTKFEIRMDWGTVLRTAEKAIATITPLHPSFHRRRRHSPPAKIFLTEVQYYLFFSKIKNSILPVRESREYPLMAHMLHQLQSSTGQDCRCFAFLVLGSLVLNGHNCVVEGLFLPETAF